LGGPTGFVLNAPLFGVVLGAIAPGLLDGPVILRREIFRRKEANRDHR
jgi:hypothetical protein